jgi:hypothetical protein
MIPQSEITELYRLWSRLSFTRLLFVSQLNDRFQIEFVLNTENPISKVFLAAVQDMTIKKHPTGSVSWVGYWSQGVGLNSQYKRYRVDFIDSTIKEEIDQEKLGMYVQAFKECLKRQLPSH